MYQTYFLKCHFYVKNPLFKLRKIIDVFSVDSFFHSRWTGIFAQSPTIKISVFVVFRNGKKCSGFCACVHRAQHLRHSTGRSVPSGEHFSLHLPPHRKIRAEQFSSLATFFLDYVGRGVGKKAESDAKKCLRRSSLFIDGLRKTASRFCLLWEKTYKNGFDGGWAGAWGENSFLMDAKKEFRPWLKMNFSLLWIESCEVEFY